MSRTGGRHSRRSTSAPRTPFRLGPSEVSYDQERQDHQRARVLGHEHRFALTLWERSRVGGSLLPSVSVRLAGDEQQRVAELRRQSPRAQLVVEPLHAQL